MITRMEILYKSVEPCDVKPTIFTTGGYEITKNGKRLNFDFLDMDASASFENGYLYISSRQKNFDESLLDGMSEREANEMIRSATKEDYSEIFYECFKDSKEVSDSCIKLIPENITFYDFSTSGNGSPIPVLGDKFSQILEFNYS